MRFAANNVAEGTIVDALHQFDKRRTIADLESYIQAQLALRTLANFDHFQYPGNIYPHRLFHVNMLSGGHYCFQMPGMVIRWCSDNYGVDILCACNLSVSVGTDEQLRSIDGRVAFALLK